MTFAKTLLAACVAFLTPVATPFILGRQAHTQELTSSERSREILASFNKTKHEAREKFGVRREKYKQIHSEPVTRQSLADYAGNYKVPDLGYTLEVARGNAGVTVAGFDAREDSHSLRRFRLENAHLEGALLTGTKVYDDGVRTPFAGLFINMTDTEGTSPTQVTHSATTFGLGVVGVHVKAGDVTTDKVFYHFEQ